jgi:hypothetical protein
MLQEQGVQVGFGINGEANEKDKEAERAAFAESEPNLVRRMICLLTISRAHHSFSSAAELLSIDERTVRRHTERREIKRFRKIKRFLIPKAQQENRRKCATNLRNLFRKADVSDFMFVDECYICIG